MKMKRVRHGGEIDLCEWEFFTTDDPMGGLRDILMKGFAAHITEVLRAQFEEDPPILHLPFMWSDRSDGMGGPKVDDPAMLHLNIQLGAGEDGVTYACSLEDVVDDMINDLVNRGTKKVEDTEGQEICVRIAIRLRELADKLNAACAMETPS